jgi:hypothetical protein
MPTPIIDVPNPLVQLASATAVGLLSASDFTKLAGISLPRVVLDEAFTDQTSLAIGSVAGPLNSAKRYKIELNISAKSGASSNIAFLPNGVGTGTFGASGGNSGSGAVVANHDQTGLVFGYYETAVSLTVDVDPRINGASQIRSFAITGVHEFRGQIWSVFRTVQDYTTFSIAFSGPTQLSGWIKVIENDANMLAIGASLNGWLLADVANNFDPMVTGLAGRVGAKVGTVDQSTAWIKVGAANTAWEVIGP